jgi:general secretion pathway protein C
MLNLPPSTADRLSRLAALVVCIAAGALCALMLVRTFWLLVPRGTEAPPAQPLVPASAHASAGTSIAQWHLFGNAQTIDLAARAANAPRTALKLVLRGTFALDDAKEGIAIIADESNIEHSVKVGETIGSATLAEVHADHVLLQHDGVAESLALPRAEERAPANASPGARANAASSGLPGIASSNPSAANMSLAPVAPALARANAADLARQVQFEPVFDGGRIAGARLTGSGAAAQLMNQVGLKPTDLVTAVNGTPLSSVSNPQQLIDKLGNAASLQVTIQRDGKPATLTLNLR